MHCFFATVSARSAIDRQCKNQSVSGLYVQRLSDAIYTRRVLPDILFDCQCKNIYWFPNPHRPAELSSNFCCISDPSPEQPPNKKQPWKVLADPKHAVPFYLIPLEQEQESPVGQMLWCPPTKRCYVTDTALFF